MPTKPLIHCRATGCRALVSSGYCDAHKSQAAQAWNDYDRNRRHNVAALSAAATIRSTSQWQKVRKLHRALYPLCCDPFRDHVQMPATNDQSHHVEPLHERPDLAFDLSNLAPLCTRCHARIEQQERAGRRTAYLFNEYKAQTPIGPMIA